MEQQKDILDILENYKFRKISKRIFLLQNSTHNNIRQSTVDLIKPLAGDLHFILDQHKMTNLIYYVSYGYEHTNYHSPNITELQTQQQIDLTYRGVLNTVSILLLAGRLESIDWSKERNWSDKKVTTKDRVLLQRTNAELSYLLRNHHKNNVSKIQHLHKPLFDNLDKKYRDLQQELENEKQAEMRPINNDIKKQSSKDLSVINKLKESEEQYKKLLDNETYRFSKGFKPLSDMPSDEK